MFKYYTVIIFINIIALQIVQVSISKRWTLTKNKKKLFSLLFSFIALAAFCEWMGMMDAIEEDRNMYQYKQEHRSKG